MEYQNYQARHLYEDDRVVHSYDSQFYGPLTIRTLRARLVGWAETCAFMHLLRQSAVRTGDVLDIATGTGRYARLLLSQGYRVTGLDISSSMLRVARQRASHSHNVFALIRGDAEVLPFSSRVFDLVVCMRLFHRVPPENRHHMLFEVKRVGKGMAILFFGMTNAWLQRRRWLRAKLIRERNSNPYPITMGRLVGDLKDMGFHVRSFRWILPILSEGAVVLVEW